MDEVDVSEDSEKIVLQEERWYVLYRSKRLCRREQVLRHSSYIVCLSISPVAKMHIVRKKT